MGSTRRIAIVGAGPAGLVAAIAARRLGFEVALFEQAPDFARVGGGTAIQPNGLRVLAALDLLDGFERFMHPLQRITVETPGGRVLAAVDYRAVAIPQNRIAVALRADLQEHLLAAARRAGVPIAFGRRSTGIARAGGSAALRFASGPDHESEVIVAADGARSQVRAGLGLRARRRATGQGALRGVSMLSLDPPAMREFWLPDGRRFGIAPLPGGRTYFYCSVPLAGWDEIRARGLEEWIEGWRRRLAGAAEVLWAVADWSAVSHDELAEIRLDRWWREPGFVVGDAAHAMTPDLGQGANSAMVDALVLMRLLATGDALDAVGRHFESLRRPFVRRLQIASRQIGLLSTWSSPPARLARRLMLAPGRLPPIARRAALLAAGHNPAEEPYLGR